MLSLANAHFHHTSVNPHGTSKLLFQGQPYQQRKQNSGRVTTCKESFHENEPRDIYCHEGEVCIRLKCGQTAHDPLGRVVLSDTGHSQSLARGKGLLKVEQGAEAKFTVITRDPGGQQFCNEQEQVTEIGRAHV